MAAYNAGNHRAAIRHLEPLAGEPGVTGLLSRFYLGQSHHQLALRHFRQMRFKEAASHFEIAARMNPSGGGVERFLSACHAKTGRFDLAAEGLRTLLDRNPEDVGARIRLALALWKQSTPEAGVKVLEEGLEARPDHAELQYQLGVMYAAREDFERAETYFGAALARDPGHAGACERLAQCRALDGEPHRALELLQRAHTLDPLNPRIGLQLSVLAQTVGEAAGTLLPGDSAPARGDLDHVAIERLGEMVAQEPDFVGAFLSLPASEVDQEVFSILAATLEEALSKHPEYADLHYHCGGVYRRLGRDAAAIAHVERAVSLNPRYVNALILLAGLYAQTARLDDGAARLEQAIQSGGDYADVHYMLGRLYQQSGQPSRARGAYERALALNGRFEQAKEALDSLATANA
jgi:tetratricopeptide (TPR) repeat protein